MARKKTNTFVPRGAQTAPVKVPKTATPAVHARHAKTPPVDGTREMIEAIAFALILAFLFRTFAGQAFVIPTGSMGPTLMGRNKDLVCPECGHEYRVGASSEVNQATGAIMPDWLVESVTCPNCRYTASVFEDPHTNTLPKEVYPSYGGDRLWVSNATYEVADPLRFDVAVFKNPEQARENYIKRIVGLPGETVRIESGNLFIKGPGEADFEIARKEPKKILAVMQTVYDHDQPAARLEAWGWPARWHSTDEGNAWVAEPEQHSFTTQGQGGAESWLRYRHLPASFDDWKQLEAGNALARQPRPQLITDFCAYDTGSPSPEYPHFEPSPRSLGLHWVGDLILEAEIELLGEEGEVVFELVEAGRRFQARIDLATGKATLRDSQNEKFAPTAATSISGRGLHEVRFANVDDKLWLWIDGNVVEFDTPTTYVAPPAERPTPDDLAPAGIASKGAELRVRHLRLSRDLYYIATRIDGGAYAQNLMAITDFDANPYLFGAERLTERKLADFMSNPEQWESFDRRRRVEFGPLADDQFFALGDNSPNSSDSRYWSDHYFERDLLIGKAFFVYWPHAWPTPWHVSLRPLGFDWQVPFYPDVRRMRLIH
ncbi:MAG: signal peptidase I [Pirellulales bacterium]|nr:signal peptidase I [Pirellulales bacterium]